MVKHDNSKKPKSLANLASVVDELIATRHGWEVKALTNRGITTFSTCVGYERNNPYWLEISQKVNGLLVGDNDLYGGYETHHLVEVGKIIKYEARVLSDNGGKEPKIIFSLAQTSKPVGSWDRNGRNPIYSISESPKVDPNFDKLKHLYEKIYRKVIETLSPH